MPDIRKIVRDRIWHALDHDTAVAAGLRLDQLQQLAIGAFHPTDAQIADLARHLRITDAA